jgi:hypothetical protein
MHRPTLPIALAALLLGLILGHILAPLWLFPATPPAQPTSARAGGPSAGVAAPAQPRQPADAGPGPVSDGEKTDRSPGADRRSDLVAPRSAPAGTADPGGDRLPGQLGATVTVTVRDPDGAPVVGAVVQIRTEPARTREMAERSELEAPAPLPTAPTRAEIDAWIAQTRDARRRTRRGVTDAEGRVVLSGVHPGSIRIDGWATGMLVEAENEEVVPGEIAGFTLQAVPLIDVPVEVRYDNGDIPDSIRVRYVVDGRSGVILWPQSRAVPAARGRRLHLTAYAEPQSATYGRAVVDVPRTGEPGPATIVVRRRHRIALALRRPDGTPYPVPLGTSVDVDRLTDAGAPQPVGDVPEKLHARNGIVAHREWPAGRYRITLRVGAHAELGVRDIDLRHGDVVDEWVITTDPTAHLIRIRFVGPAGEPLDSLPGRMVAMVRHEADDGWSGTSKGLQPAGEPGVAWTTPVLSPQQLAGPQREAELMVTHRDFGTVLAPVDPRADELTIRFAAPVTLRVTATNIGHLLGREGLKEVTVGLDAARGDPLHNRLSRLRATMTDAGVAEFPALQPGRQLEIRLSAGVREDGRTVNRTLARQTITLAGEAEVTVTLDLPRIHRVVVDAGRRFAGEYVRLQLAEARPSAAAAKVGPEGRAVFPLLPAGRYRIVLGDQSMAADIRADGMIIFSPDAATD